MAVPKKRKTRGKTNQKHAQKRMVLPDFSICSKCDSIKQNHFICNICYFYNGIDYSSFLKKNKK